MEQEVIIGITNLKKKNKAAIMVAFFHIQSCVRSAAGVQILTFKH